VEKVVIRMKLLTEKVNVTAY